MAQAEAFYEHRTYRRTRCHRQALLREAAATGVAAQAIAVDLSPGGLRLKVPVAYAQHAAVEVELRAEGDEAQPVLPVPGRVVWCQQAGQSWICGVRLWMKRAAVLPPSAQIRSREEAMLVLTQLAQSLPGAQDDLYALSPTPRSLAEPDQVDQVTPGLPARKWPWVSLLSLLLILLMLAVHQAVEYRREAQEESFPDSSRVARADFARGFVTAPTPVRAVLPPVGTPGAAPGILQPGPLSAPRTPSRAEIQGLLATAEFTLLHQGPAQARPLFEEVIARGVHLPQELRAAQAGLAEARAAAGDVVPAETMAMAHGSVGDAVFLGRAPTRLAPSLKPRAGLELALAETPLGMVAPVHIVVKLDEYLMQVKRHGAILAEFPVGIGMDGRTPRGNFTIANKLEQPTWYNKGQGVPPSDPRNPLGAYWMGLGTEGRATSYGIHPTNAPESIGRSQSRGCIRMRPEDAALVFQWCEVGTPVTIL